MDLNDLVLADETAPESVEFAFGDDIVIKAIRFDPHHPSIGNQHMHAHDHISVVLGPFMVAMGDEGGIPDTAPLVAIGAPGQSMMVTVEAHKYHRFCSLAPGGILLCISRGHGTGKQVIEKPAGKLKD